MRVLVERGNMPYSAVTQPKPVLRRKGGVRSSKEAVHRYQLVFAIRNSGTDPSAVHASSFGFVEHFRGSVGSRSDQRGASHVLSWGCPRIQGGARRNASCLGFEKSGDFTVLSGCFRPRGLIECPDPRDTAETVGRDERPLARGCFGSRGRILSGNGRACRLAHADRGLSEKVSAATVSEREARP